MLVSLMVHAVALAPPAPPELSGSICAGEHHSCAVTMEGKVLCWGRGDDGRLGNGAEVRQLRPVMTNLGDDIRLRVRQCSLQTDCDNSGAVSTWTQYELAPPTATSDRV